ncbi:MAG TPA: hypothetical protein VII05_00330, partial [Gaiellaceae bacterium]
MSVVPMSVPVPLCPSTVAEAGAAFLSYLKRRGRSEKTLAKYRPYLDTLALWAGERSPASLTTVDIDFGFLTYWGDGAALRGALTPGWLRGKRRLFEGRPNSHPNAAYTDRHEDCLHLREPTPDQMFLGRR